MAIGAGLSIVTILTHAIAVASWVPYVAIIVSLGVGVDYALFVVSRHRNDLLAGQTPEDAAVTALNTSGRAVLLAGLTVCVALLGLFALQVSSLYGVAVTVALVVGLTMVASLTLLPAMLGFLGLKVRREPNAGCSHSTGARSSRQEPSGCAGPKGSARRRRSPPSSRWR